MICPINWTPEKHQLPVIANPARFKVVVWHRKAHKTTLAINELLRWANAVPGTYWYVAPFMSQARKIVWEDPEMLAKYCPQPIWEGRNNSEMKIPFPNGSMLYVLGADNPDSLRGPNPKGIVLDEYDDMRPEIWSAVIQPIMAANPKAWTWFTGTYKGRKDLYNKYVYAQDPTNGWYSSILKASMSGIIADADLEEARKTTTEAFYKQEYECDPVENAAGFFKRIDENVWDGNLPADRTARYQMGVDLAKYNDFTVITKIDTTTYNVGRQERFNQIDWNLQKSRIEATWLRYYKPRLVMDSTGLGDPIFDDLAARGMKNIEAYKFTEESRRQLLVNLQIMIEQDKIKIPNDEQLLNELKSFQYVLTTSKTGKPKITIKVPDNVHDDCVMSLALSVWGLPDRPRGKKRDVERETLKEFDYFKKDRAGYGLTGSRYLAKQ